jgi:hypothetical protein
MITIQEYFKHFKKNVNFKLNLHYKKWKLCTLNSLDNSIKEEKREKELIMINLQMIFILGRGKIIKKLVMESCFLVILLKRL